MMTTENLDIEVWIDKVMLVDIEFEIKSYRNPSQSYCFIQHKGLKSKNSARQT